MKKLISGIIRFFEWRDRVAVYIGVILAILGVPSIFLIYGPFLGTVVALVMIGVVVLLVFTRLPRSTAAQDPGRALLLQALHYETRGELQQAVELYQEIMKQFPGTPAAAEAGSYMAALQERE